MRSRYDLCQSSTVTAPDGSKYKDILTMPLQKFVYKDNTLEATLTKPDILRPDYLGSTLYNGEDELEDIILWLNTIGLLQYSISGDTLDIPTKKDLEEFYYSYRI